MRLVNLQMLAILMLACPLATAQTAWDVLLDVDPFGQLISESQCGVVNAVDWDSGELIQLVILSDTAELLVVSSPWGETDRVLFDAFVDRDNLVCGAADLVGDMCLGESLLGEIAFFDDGDGFRTVWWVWFNETVIEVDRFTDDVILGTTYPEEYLRVPCDACRFVDFPSAGFCDDLPDGDSPPIVVNVCGYGIGGLGFIMLTICGFSALACLRPSRPTG